MTRLIRVIKTPTAFAQTGPNLPGVNTSWNMSASAYEARFANDGSEAEARADGGTRIAQEIQVSGWGFDIAPGTEIEKLELIARFRSENGDPSTLFGCMLSYARLDVINDPGAGGATSDLRLNNLDMVGDEYLFPQNHASPWWYFEVEKGSGDFFQNLELTNDVINEAGANVLAAAFGFEVYADAGDTNAVIMDYVGLIVTIEAPDIDIDEPSDALLSLVHFEHPVPRVDAVGVLASGPNHRHTRRVSEVVPRRYELPLRTGNAADLSAMRQAIEETRGGAGLVRWRHPQDDEPDPAEAPLWRILNASQAQEFVFGRRRGGHVTQFDLVLEEYVF